MVRTYSFPGFYEATGNLGLQPFARVDQVETNSSPCYVATNGTQLRLHLLKHWTMSEITETAHETLSYEPIQPGSGRGRKLRERAAGIGAALVALAAKGKTLLLLLPKLKLLATFGSAFVSIAAYAHLWGWPFAVGFVASLFLHELGHVIQLRREGVKASAPMFIPFLGAVITARSMGDDAAAEARVGLAGPILGAVASLVPLALWLATRSDFWQALAY